MYGDQAVENLLRKTDVGWPRNIFSGPSADNEDRAAVTNQLLGILTHWTAHQEARKAERRSFKSGPTNVKRGKHFKQQIILSRVYEVTWQQLSFNTDSLLLTS